MTQTETYTQQSSLPLPDAFSAELTTLFTTVQPSVVQIHTEGRGAGTGIIWNADGQIITNNHVVAKDNARVQVFLADGRTLDAKVLHRNPLTRPCITQSYRRKPETTWCRRLIKTACWRVGFCCRTPLGSTLGCHCRNCQHSENCKNRR